MNRSNRNMRYRFFDYLVGRRLKGESFDGVFESFVICAREKWIVASLEF